MPFSDLLESETFLKLAASAIVFLLTFLVQRLVVRSITEKMPDDRLYRLRIQVTTRNIALLILAAAMVVIWIHQLREVAAGLLVVAAAVVIATKELLMQFLGYAFRTGNRFFRTGDRIVVAGMRGDVIDENMLGAELLEVGPGELYHQFTGRAIFVPNSTFLTAPVVNETYLGEYVFHIITVPVKRNEDWQAHEQALLLAANEACAPYRDAAKQELDEFQKERLVDAPSMEPRVHIRFVDPEKMDLVLRLPVPARHKGRKEQEVLRRYSEELRLKAAGGAQS